jgi:hypothetical protein
MGEADVIKYGKFSHAEHEAGPLQRILRTSEFWSRATGIYLGFKVDCKPPWLLSPARQPILTSPMLACLDAVACVSTSGPRASRRLWLVQVTQVKAALCRSQGWSEDAISAKIWRPQHERAGRDMYSLCVDLRGFYLKVCALAAARGRCARRTGGRRTVGRTNGGIDEWSSI